MHHPRCMLNGLLKWHTRRGTATTRSIMESMLIITAVIKEDTQHIHIEEEEVSS